MSIFINDTSHYHKTAIDTLGWELTVCNALEDPDGPLRAVLKKKLSFGSLLALRLKETIALHNVSSILEAGGGYGYLMRDLLPSMPGRECLMLDISPRMLEFQKKNLAHLRPPPQFIETDFLEYPLQSLCRFDLVLMNENAGDLPAVINAPFDEVISSSGGSAVLQELRHYIKRYSLAPLCSPEGNISLNTGALKAVEKICEAGIKYAYLSEHSCEAAVPPELSGLIEFKSKGFPEKISLKGHDEYTVAFSQLAAVAAHHGYRVIRGQYADFIEPALSDRLRFILSSKSSAGFNEDIRYFIEDLYKYEYLIMVRG